MSNSDVNKLVPFTSRAKARPDDRAPTEGSMPSVWAYAASAALVALATGLGLSLQGVAPPASITLIFVLPVVVAASSFGFAPSLAATALGVLSFDFFFTRPYYSLTIDSPEDIWSAALLLIIASIVSAVAANARRRAVDSRHAAEQADALRSLAHTVVEAPSRPVLAQAAATALSRIFRAPAVVFVDQGGTFDGLFTSVGAKLTLAEMDAARGVLDLRLPSRGETYPFATSRFDFWPVASRSGAGYVLGVEFRGPGGRPSEPERFVEVIAAYLANFPD
jgi:two-component system sensor histidine kinase KdpD